MVTRNLHALLALSLVVLILALATIDRARACAWVTKAGHHLEVTTEAALIVWDEKAKRQHFIRRATFDAKVPYFGFLVPSPTPPDLAEAPDELFTDLSSWTRPEVRTEKRYFTPGGWLRAKESLGKDLGPPGAVAVLDERRVGGLDAVVLKATDAKALHGWLERHGYATRPALEAWLLTYVKAGWVITAFRIPKEDQSSDRVETKAVRMSFTTEQPFFPYSEPPDKRDDKDDAPFRSLRIFLIAAGRMQGALDAPRVPWSGKAAWARPLADARRAAVTRHLGAEAVQLPEEAWLTVFDDFGSPRVGVADVYFSRSPDQSWLLRPPIVYYEDAILPSWTMLILCVLVTLAAAVLYRFRHLATRRPAK